MKHEAARSVFAAALCCAAAAGAQDSLDSPRWLERNYRHADVQTTLSTQQLEALRGAADPLLAGMRELQQDTIRVARHAALSENLQAAVDAIRESRANLMSMGALTGRLPAGRATADTYLIAFRDGTVRVAVAYWVDGDTLHYVGSDRREQQAPLQTVDRDLSLKLNRERNVEVKLEPPR